MGGGGVGEAGGACRWAATICQHNRECALARAAEPRQSFAPPRPWIHPHAPLQVNVVGDALLFLGKLAVAACCGLGAFGLANLPYYNDAEVRP